MKEVFQLVHMDERVSPSVAHKGQPKKDAMSAQSCSVVKIIKEGRGRPHPGKKKKKGRRKGALCGLKGEVSC